MNQPGVTDALNRLLGILCRSLAQYLQEARPWTRREHAKLVAALADLAADQRFYAGRVAERILAEGGYPEPGSFPMEFAGVNDVGLEAIVPRLLEWLDGDIAAIGAVIDDLGVSPEDRVLAEEALGNAQGHREILARL